MVNFVNLLVDKLPPCSGIKEEKRENATYITLMRVLVCMYIYAHRSNNIYKILAIVCSKYNIFWILHNFFCAVDKCSAAPH